MSQLHKQSQSHLKGKKWHQRIKGEEVHLFWINYWCQSATGLILENKLPNSIFFYDKYLLKIKKEKENSLIEINYLISKWDRWSCNWNSMIVWNCNNWENNAPSVSSQ